MPCGFRGQLAVFVGRDKRTIRDYSLLYESILGRLGSGSVGLNGLQDPQVIIGSGLCLWWI